MNVDITVLVGIVGTIMGIVLGVFKAKKDSEKETKEEAANDTSVAIQLNYISKGIDEIRIDNKVRDKQMMEFIERLVAVEKSASSAHYRVDEVQELIQKLINKEGI